MISPWNQTSISASKSFYFIFFYRDRCSCNLNIVLCRQGAFLTDAIFFSLLAWTELIVQTFLLLSILSPCFVVQNITYTSSHARRQIRGECLDSLSYGWGSISGHILTLWGLRVLWGTALSEKWNLQGIWSKKKKKTHLGAAINMHSADGINTSTD